MGSISLLTNQDGVARHNMSYRSSRSNGLRHPGIHIPDNSPEAHALEQEMRAQNVGPEEAVLSILRHADRRNAAQRMIGLFSSDEDAAIMEEVAALLELSRQTTTTREIGLP